MRRIVRLCSRTDRGGAASQLRTAEMRRARANAAESAFGSASGPARPGTLQITLRTFGTLCDFLVSARIALRSITARCGF